MNNTKQLIETILQDSLFVSAHWGILVESLNTGEILYEHNADKLFIPASNQKILTSAAALLSLGSDFTYETKLYASGEIIDSVLYGDLIIEGSGDPTFSSEFYVDPRLPFYCWTDTLRKLGIRKINGNIIGNDDAFDEIKFGKGWMIDDLNYAFAAETNGLQFNENSIKLQIIPPLNFHKPSCIFPELKSEYFKISNNLVTAKNPKSRITLVRPFDNNEIIVSGDIGIGSRIDYRTISLSNPTIYFVTVLKEFLLEEGFEITGTAFDCDDIENWNFVPENLSLIAVHKSPPLIDILQVMMKKSKNLYAETLLKTISWKQNGIGSFSDSRKIVQNFLLDFDLKPEQYSYFDGSGLSRYNLISPQQIVKVLKGVKQTEQNSFWEDIMPVAGIFLETPAVSIIRTVNEGNIKAKTGTMTNIRCLSGYVETPRGDAVFSILVNCHKLNSNQIDQQINFILASVLENL
ncbi:MAG: hypothetical protein APR54_09585 [Candidatus Cloacimonas sp. SDB]|nr:MAG: hypothetical protein APR54_09585 [Candidatus Cloacimonas sp. SDB]